jgi:hypothetical protein
MYLILLNDIEHYLAIYPDEKEEAFILIFLINLEMMLHGVL